MRGWMTAGVLGAAVLGGQVWGQEGRDQARDLAEARQRQEHPEPPVSLDDAMLRAEEIRADMREQALLAVQSGDPMHALLVIDSVMDVLPDDIELREALETVRGPGVEAALKRAARLREAGQHGAVVEMLAPVYVATGDERVGAALKEARFWREARREEGRGGEWRGGDVGGRGFDEGELRRVMEQVDRVNERLERLEGKFTFSGRAEPAVDELRRAMEDTRRDVERLSTDLRREVDSLSREVMSLRREVDRLRR
ncbi:MAG: hypothetical protein AB7G17_00125 [Phycisphaerales bacterium]